MPSTYPTPEEAREQRRLEEDIRIRTVVKFTVISLLGLVALICLIAFWPFTTIPAGYVGVKTQWGKVVPEVYDSGFHLLTPMRDTMHRVYVGTNRVDEKLAASSNDQQVVTVDLALNYHITPEASIRIFRDLNNEEVTRVVQPSMVEAAKATISQYSAPQLIAKRDEISGRVGEAIRAKLARYGIAVDGASLLNIDFSDDYNAAIERAATAQQRAIQAENEVKQTQWEAQKSVVQSQAEVQVAENHAKAVEAEGKALAANPAVLEKLKLERWNGQYPQYIGGGQPVPFIQVK